MKKKFTISLAFFCLTILIDLFSKHYFSNSLNVHFNRGFIFGTLQSLPASLTLITLTSVGAFLVFVYLLFLLILQEELFFLKIGLGFLSGGILGNVIDRALHGGTIDFIPLSLMGKTILFFNMADLFQWIGALIIIYNLLFKEKIIWYPENQRSFGLINPKEQIKFALKFSFVSFTTSLILGIFSISYLTLTLKQVRLDNNSTVLGFAISYLALSVIFLIFSFISGLILSNKTAGPLYAFEKYVESLLSGSIYDLKLREGDNFKHLIEVADQLKKHFENS